MEFDSTLKIKEAINQLSTVKLDSDYRVSNGQVFVKILTSSEPTHVINRANGSKSYSC